MGAPPTASTRSPEWSPARAAGELESGTPSTAESRGWSAPAQPTLTTFPNGSKLERATISRLATAGSPSRS
jgi:hypothetical protein